MELNELIMDAIGYPSKNLKALGIYMLISIIIGIILVATGLTNPASIEGVNIIVALIGIIIVLALLFLIEGFVLDIIKFAIERRNDAPDVDFARQVSNGVKNTIVAFVFVIIPLLVYLLAGKSIIGVIITFILLIIFGLLLIMAQCRLAETENLGDALNIKAAYDDLMAIGLGKVVLTYIVIVLIIAIISGIVSGIFTFLGSELLTSIVTCIVETYLLFFENRAIGLLYSDR